jgi:hypothetical protein
MPSNTRSAKPRNRSGLQRQPPPAEKRKRAESAADKANKKPKATPTENTEADDNDAPATGKGKGPAKGKKKGAKGARYVAPPTMPHPLTPFRKTAANRAQEDAAADAAGAPSQLTRCVHPP